MRGWLIWVKPPPACTALKISLGGRAGRSRSRSPAELRSYTGPGAMVDVAQARVVVGVAAIGDHLARAHDQLAGMRGLVAADLTPRGVGHVVGQGDEVEPRAALRRAGGRRSRTSRSSSRRRARSARRARGSRPRTTRLRRGPASRRRRRARTGPTPTADRVERSISTRHATRPSESPSACEATAATPSSTAHSPAGIGPGRKPRVVWPWRWSLEFARYCASVEKPLGDTVTSGWLEPPQPRNSGSAHGAPGAGRASHSPRSSTCLMRAFVGASGWSWQ